MAQTESSEQYGTFEVADKEQLATPVVAKDVVAEGWRYHAWTGVLIASWWALSSVFNTENKKALLATPAPLTVATIQLAIGCCWFIPLWLTGLRAAPTFRSNEIFMTKIFPLGVMHGICHGGGVCAMGAGQVVLSQIIKAAEPVTTSLLTIFVLKYVFSIWTNLALIPIVGGIYMVSMTSSAFNWSILFYALISTMGASLRGVYAKKTMLNAKAIGTNLDSANIFSLLTLVATITLIPFFLIFEGFSLYYKWGTGPKPASTFWIWVYIIRSGACHYANNELSFRTLGRLNQLSHAVANTTKKIAAVLWASAVLGEHLGWKGWVGSAITVFGTFLFSYAKSRFG